MNHFDRYTPEQREAVEEHIRERFGEISHLLREPGAPDICVIAPSPERDWYTLVTLGMGGKRMRVPEGLEHRARAELVLYLPPDWEIDSEEDRWTWPLRLMWDSAQLPVEEGSWLGWGHSIASRDGKSYDESVGFSGVLLVDPEEFGGPAANKTLPDGEIVNFYVLLPLYPQEMDFKLDHSADALLDLMYSDPELGFLCQVDPDRKNYCAPETLEEPWAQAFLEDLEEQDNSDALMLDAAELHLERIRSQNLPVDDLAALNHMAIFLEWCIRHGMVSDTFLDDHGDVAAAIREGGPVPDLRLLLRDGGLEGTLLLTDLNSEGVAFARWYYWDDDNRSHFYPRDVQTYAEEYFAKEAARDEEFRKNAYLYLPWNERIRQALSRIIDRQFARWQAMGGSGVAAKKIRCIRTEEIRPLLSGWKGPRACFASDRILVDGCRVGVCRREEPEPGDRGWDSGWRFLAGDESDAYMNNPAHFGICDLNVLCNCDPDVLPLLRAPHGTRLERDRDGKFYVVQTWSI